MACSFGFWQWGQTVLGLSNRVALGGGAVGILWYFKMPWPSGLRRRKEWSSAGSHSELTNFFPSFFQFLAELTCIFLLPCSRWAFPMRKVRLCYLGSWAFWIDLSRLKGWPLLSSSWLCWVIERTHVGITSFPSHHNTGCRLPSVTSEAASRLGAFASCPSSQLRSDWAVIWIQFFRLCLVFIFHHPKKQVWP